MEENINILKRKMFGDTKYFSFISHIYLKIIASLAKNILPLFTKNKLRYIYSINL